MNIDEQIKAKMTDYYRRGKSETALELASLFLQLAEEEKLDEEKRAGIIFEFLWWLRAASLSIPRYLKRVHCWLERERIKRLLKIAHIAGAF